MRKEFVIHPTRAGLPFSQAIRAGDFIFVSGTTGMRDSQNKPVEGIEAQTIQCLENIDQVLKTAGASLEDVVKATVYLKNSDDFATMNAVYVKYFPESRPTRSTVITGLVNPEMLIEIECIAYKP